VFPVTPLAVPVAVPAWPAVPNELPVAGRVVEVAGALPAGRLVVPLAVPLAGPLEVPPVVPPVEGRRLPLLGGKVLGLVVVPLVPPVPVRGAEGDVVDGFELPNLVGGGSFS